MYLLDAHTIHHEAARDCPYEHSVRAATENSCVERERASGCALRSDQNAIDVDPHLRSSWHRNREHHAPCTRFIGDKRVASPDQAARGAIRVENVRRRYGI